MSGHSEEFSLFFLDPLEQIFLPAVKLWGQEELRIVVVAVIVVSFKLTKGWPRHFSRCLKCFSLLQRETWRGHPLVLCPRFGFSVIYFPDFFDFQYFLCHFGASIFVLAFDIFGSLQVFKRLFVSSCFYMLSSFTLAGSLTQRSLSGEKTSQTQQFCLYPRDADSNKRKVSFLKIYSWHSIEDYCCIELSDRERENTSLNWTVSVLI